MGKMPVFLDQPAKCHVSSGAVFFVWDGFQIALPISTCIANIAECRRAIAQWEKARGEVVPMRAGAAAPH